MAQTNINIRMDENLKKDFDSLCNDLGLTMTTAFNIFAKTMVRQQKIPFEVSMNGGGRGTVHLLLITSQICYDICEVIFMPRQARKLSETGIYHVMLRGINRQNIFLDEEDNYRFILTLEECKKISEFNLYAYCLMSNHVHLLLKTEKEDLSQIFKRIGARYVFWYNWKYQRIGHLFQDRFKSEPIEDEKYFLTVLRYIMQNPIKANLCKEINGYRWSSYQDYLNQTGITDTDYVLNIFGNEITAAKQQLISFIIEQNEDICLELEAKRKRITDEELVKMIEIKYKLNPTIIQNLTQNERKETLKKLLKIEGITTRQLARITGLSANVIWKL